MQAQEGGFATISCEISCPGASVSWIKDGEPLGSSEKFEMQNIGSQALLTVKELEPRDSGEYICKTSDATAAAKLHIEGLAICFSSLHRVSS